MDVVGLRLGLGGLGGATCMAPSLLEGIDDTKGAALDEVDNP